MRIEDGESGVGVKKREVELRVDQSFSPMRCSRERKKVDEQERRVFFRLATRLIIK